MMCEKRRSLRERLFYGLVLFPIVLCVSVIVMNQPCFASSQSRRVVIDSMSGYAIFGYDPVAYFTQHRAVHGKREYEYVWHGVSWIFVSRANLAVFKDSPEVYSPQYGGHCALGMARGYVADSNPNIWALFRDRLYFFYSYTNRAVWAEAIDHHIELADEYWIEIENNLAR